MPDAFYRRQMRSRRRRIVVEDQAFRLIERSADGGDDGPTIVLVHGIGMSHRCFRRLSDALPTGARVLSIDMPGHGGLSRPHRDLDVRAMGALLATLLRRAGIVDATLVGHSMGAQWVVEAAHARPELARQIVLLGPVVDSRHRSIGAQARALVLDACGETPAGNLVVLGDYLRCGTRWYAAQARHMVAYRLDERVGALALPVFVVRGSADPVAGRSWCRILAEAATEGSLQEIPGQRHNAHHSAPAAVASVIVGALRAAAVEDGGASSKR